MIKNALLSLKKNIGKTILLFVIIVVITNLVIAGLSIQSATQKSMDQIRSSLGNDVTLSVDFRNMMKNREPGAAVSNETSLTTTMADSLKNLKYVESYNYQISTSADSDSISAVENESDNSNNQQDTKKPNDQPEQASNQGDFTISANTTMEYLDSFTNSNYTLTDGRLLTSDDANTNNCVIETNLASDNDLSVGDTFTITTTVNDETIIQELTIVGIYEIQSTNEIGAAHFNNPVNTIYTDLSVGQTLTGSSENITSAIYYLDDPENAEAFVELAKKKSDIDFDTFSLDANDRLYQQNASSLESMQSFAKMFVWIVVIAGSAILCLILALTIRNRYYEIGVLLSLGQSKVKIIAQQLIEIGLIAVVAFVLSLGTGQLTSHYMGNMLESGSSSNVMQMNQKGDQSNDNQQKNNTQTKENFLGNMMEGPSNQELDVSITGENVIQLAGVTAAICIVSIAVPAAYVLRLTPRQILSRKVKMEKLLELENVSYSYQDGKEKNKILEHVSYSFEKGKIYAVVGASGSGKTTTLSLSSGLDKPDEGKVLFKGKDIQEIGLNKYRREDISIVFQSYNLIYYMNALENVMSALEIAGIKRKDKKEYCLSILEQLGLSKDECKRDIRQLSGGQQQRVAIARAIAREVDLILCDEPTGNLDEKNSIEIMNTFLDLAHIHHKCVILVTHSPTLAKMCDVSLKIKEGKIEAKR